MKRLILHNAYIGDECVVMTFKEVLEELDKKFGVNKNNNEEFGLLSLLTFIEKIYHDKAEKSS